VLKVDLCEDLTPFTPINRGAVFPAARVRPHSLPTVRLSQRPSRGSSCNVSWSFPACGSYPLGLLARRCLSPWLSLLLRHPTAVPP